MNQPDQKQVKPFAAVLQELAKGRVHEEASQALADLTAAVVETGKKGTLTLVITVGAFSKANVDTLAVTGQVTAKPPLSPAPASVFFPDSAGNLHRHDPNQPTLPLRDINVTREDPAA